MSWRRQVAKIAALFRRPKAADDLEAEIRSHVQMQELENLESGMSREEAYYAARRRFGNVILAEERSREMWTWGWLEQALQDARYGVRRFRRSPGFTAVALLTLGLGIGANTAIFSLIDSVMLRMLPVHKPDELVQVYRHDPSWPGLAGRSLTNPLWEQIRDQQDIFSGVFAWGDERFDIARGGAVQWLDGLWVSGDFFSTLGLRPATGRLISISDDRRACPAVAVLSYGFWQDHYGGAGAAVGTVLPLNRHPFQVIGIAPPGFYGMEAGSKFDVALPICAAAMFDGKDSRLDERSAWWLWAAGRLKPGMTRAQAAARLAVLSPRILSAALPQDWSSKEKQNFLRSRLTAVPLATGISYLRARFSEPLTILMAVVGLVLLIACTNLASLVLARAARTRKEVAVRLALGASRTRLIRQLVTEYLLLSLSGAMVGLLFARWGSALLVRFISTSVNTVFLDLSLDRRTLEFTLVTTMLTAILFGLLPALRSSRISLTSAMKGSLATGNEGTRRVAARKLIATSQLALSLILLVSAGLLLRSFANLVTLDIGFDRNNVLLADIDLGNANVPADQQTAAYDAIEERLRAIPGVISAGRSDVTPISGLKSIRHIRADWSKLTNGEAEAWYLYASPGYFPTLRIPLVAGRSFDGRDTRSAPRVAIVNQTLARKFFPNVNPIGRALRMEDAGGIPGPSIEVVGIVRDSKYGSVRESPPPTIFLPASQPMSPLQSESFELRTGLRPSALTNAVQAAVIGVNKAISVDFHVLTDQVNDSLAPDRLLALLSVFFGALALLLAMIGLYGTLSYLVSQRQTEFGVRIALGAMPGSIRRLVLRELAVVLAAGLVTGTCLSCATARLLQGMLFGLSARDPLTLLGAAGLLSAVALVAGYVPARRAAQVDPVVALRYE